MKFRLAKAAAADVRTILEYLATESILAKANFEARLERVFANLREQPMIGRQTDRRGIRMTNTHPFPYLVYYRASPSEILILRVLHGARSPRSMPARPR
jgi:plasmid stabilization system protein ParE